MQRLTEREKGIALAFALATDGSIGLKKQRTKLRDGNRSARYYLYPALTVTNTERHLCDIFRSWFGGYVTRAGLADPETHRKAIYVWHCDSQIKVAYALGIARPFLPFKTEQADAVLEFIHIRQAKGRKMGFKNSPYGRKEVALRNRVYELNNGTADLYVFQEYKP